MKILTCNSNRPLAEAISTYLNLPLIKASVRRFSDMEIFVEIQENVRGEDVFVVQSTSYPANDNLMELLVTLDALKRASTRRTTAVIPYYGYARQDRKSASRTPISAKLVANMITTAGADRGLMLDLHAGQIRASSIFRPTTSTPPRSSSRTSRTAIRARISSSSRPMSAASSGRASSRGGSMPTLPSSTRGASGPASPRS
jgi:ribose-phosphate pyrophosphokinase